MCYSDGSNFYLFFYFLVWPNMLNLTDSDYVLEEEAREYVNSVHIDDDPVDKYSLPEQPQEEDFEVEVVVEEAPAEESLASHHNVVGTVQETPAMPLEEPVREPPRKTYASIVSILLLLIMQVIYVYDSWFFFFLVSHCLFFTS